MTGPNEFEDPLTAALNERAVEMDDEAFRLLKFHALVPDVEGPVGSLLRMIAHVHNAFEEAKSLYGTTEGEANRLFAVLEEAMSTLEWLREGEQS